MIPIKLYNNKIANCNNNLKQNKPNLLKFKNPKKLFKFS